MNHILNQNDLKKIKVNHGIFGKKLVIQQLHLISIGHVIWSTYSSIGVFYTKFNVKNLIKIN